MRIIDIPLLYKLIGSEELQKRLLKLVQYIVAVTYSCATILLIIFFLSVSLDILAHEGYFDKVEEKEILCTSPAESDGINTFHGRNYKRPSLSFLENLQNECVANELSDIVYNEYYGDSKKSDFGFPQKYIDKYLFDDVDCSRVGARHRELFESKFSRVCKDLQPNSNAVITNKISPNYSFTDEFTSLATIASILLLLSYMINYVVFGITSIMPWKHFKNRT